MAAAISVYPATSFSMKARVSTALSQWGTLVNGTLIGGAAHVA